MFSTQSVSAYPYPDQVQIIPLPEMQRSDADISLLALNLDPIMYFQEPIDDPLFSAHKLLDFRSQRNYSYYASDYPARVIGCAAQNEFCYARRGHGLQCSPPDGVPLQIETDRYPDASDNQIAALDALRRFAFLNDISNSLALSYLCVASLRSLKRKYVLTTHQSSSGQCE
jgi:hypothetical protein